ncbi:MAG: SulP family inorganic anion transporter, partial [Alphaproteobacteria bacterium]|nr:SulP family inorganic anion transporter [Alphaproteobacteria bacterium]
VPIALSLALLSSIDTLLTSKAVTQALWTKNNYNKDLIGIGVANTVSSLFGGFAGSNSTVPTMANIKFGGRARLSALCAAGVLLSVLFFFAPIAAMIPLAVLAGILVRVGIGIIDWKLLWKIITLKTRKRDAAAMITVLVFTMFGQLVAGVVIGTMLYYTMRYARYKMLISKSANWDSQY